MARINSADTEPEVRLRSMLHRLGYRFRLRRSDLPGTPDIVLPRYRTVVFVHGCFWHRHQGCKFAYTPKTRPDFWGRKFVANQARDRRALAALRKLGWRPVVVWECELRAPVRLRARLRRLLSKPDHRQMPR